MTDHHNEPCPTCLSTELKPRWKCDGLTRRISGLCARCGRFRGWLVSSPAMCLLADENEPHGGGPGLFDEREEE